MRRLLLLLLSAAVLGVAQQPSSVPPPSESQEVIQLNDQLLVTAADVTGIGEKPFPLDADGNVTLPLAGQIRAEKLTVEQFRQQVIDRLRTYIRSPQVSVKLLGRTAEDRVVLAGGFKNPGLHTLTGQRSLLSVITAAGGLQPNAGSTIKIIRRAEMGPIPLPSAVEDPKYKVHIATVNLTRLTENPNAVQHLIVKPNDVLSAERSGTVFLTGEILRPGPYELSDRESIGLTELVSMAGGFSRNAAPEKARVLRQILNGSKRAEIAVDITRILDGHSFDFAIQPTDIVVVPRSKSKAGAAATALRYVVPAALSAVIYTAVRR